MGFKRTCRDPPAIDTKVPFVELLPMRLKDKVSGKLGRTNDVACLPEMMNLFSCLAKHESDSLRCPKEVKVFQTCYAQHLAKKADYKARGQHGILVPGQKVNEMTSQQVDSLLRMYPLAKFMKRFKV